jgi:hypothetical protein
MLVAGLTGTGMLTSIPQTVLMLLLLGWVGRSSPVEEETPEAPEEAGAGWPAFASQA